MEGCARANATTFRVDESDFATFDSLVHGENEGKKKEEKIKKIEIPPNDDDITTLSRKCCLPPLI